jgi:C4-dicarboxylate-specific signal transduction histidine kinase
MVVNQYSRIILANRAFYECFKLDKKQVESKPMYEVLPVRILYEMVSDILAGKETEPFLEFNYVSDGHERIFIGNVLLTQKEEALVILSDVTIEREKQERLYLTDRLASIGEMSSGIAHELNNPLTSIISLTQLLLEEDLSSEEQEDIEVINKEAQRAATIVKNLLSFARKHQPVRQPTQINKIIEDVLQLRKYEHKLSDIQVCTHFDAKLPDTMVDYFQMQQVFLNIVLNAENAVTGNQQQKPLLDIATRRTNGTIKILFKDNGSGIAPEHMNHIFDPFFTTKGVGKGTGLGLSICYGIISAHGGKIYAQSKSGQGTTFIVELPVSGRNGKNRNQEN